MSSSRKYPYLSNRRDLSMTPPSTALEIPRIKLDTIIVSSLIGISRVVEGAVLEKSLLWERYGYFLELHKIIFLNFWS